MKHSLQLKLGQHLTLTPQLQQSIRLLQLSTLELSQEVEQMLDADFAKAREIAREESRQTHRLQQLGMRVARLISPIL